jgi:nucleoside-diphosphate-sugar epimerase
MRVLICGGAGYIGSALYDYLKSHGHDPISIDLQWFGNPREDHSNRRHNYSHVDQALLSQCDAIIITAAHSSASMCQNDPYGAFQNNAANFVGLLPRIQQQKLIYMSSSCVYSYQSGPPSPIGIESQNNLIPGDHLTLTKLTIDRYAQMSEVEYYGLRLGSVAGYSPNLRGDLMVNAMVLSAMKTGKVHVSNADKFRPILAMRDLVQAIEQILTGGDHRGIYNLCSFNARIDDVAQAVAGQFGAEIVRGPDTPTYDFTISTAKYHSTYRHRLLTRLEAIIEDLVENEPRLNVTMRERAPQYVFVSTS